MKIISKSLATGLVCLFISQADAGTISVGWIFPEADLSNTSGFALYLGSASGGYDAHLDITDFQRGICRLDPTFVQIRPTDTIPTGDCAPPALPFPPRTYVAVKAFRNGTSRLESVNFSNEISGYPRPQVNSFAPAVATQGDSIALSVAGINFLPSTYISLFRTSGGQVPGIDAWSSASDCQNVGVTFEFGGGAKDGSRYAQVGHHQLAADQIDLGCSMPGGDICTGEPIECVIEGASATPFDVLFRPWLADINGNGTVDDPDKSFIVQRFGQKESSPQAQSDRANWNRANLDGNDIIDGSDLAFIYYYYGQSVTSLAPTASLDATNAALTRGTSWQGDLNHDGVIDWRDAFLLNRYFLRRGSHRRIPPFVPRRPPTRTRHAPPLLPRNGPGSTNPRTNNSRPPSAPAAFEQKGLIGGNVLIGEDSKQLQQEPRDSSTRDQFLDMVSQLIENADRIPKVHESSNLPLLGDIYEDHKVDGKDLALLASFVGKNRENLFDGQKVRIPNDWFVFDRADLDHSGEVNLADVRIFKLIFSGRSLNEVSTPARFPEGVTGALAKFVSTAWVRSQQESSSAPLPPKLELMITNLDRIEKGEPYKYGLDLNMDRQVSGADVALIVWKEMPDWFRKAQGIATLPDLPEKPEIYLGSKAK